MLPAGFESVALDRSATGIGSGGQLQYSDNILSYEPVRKQWLHN